MIYCMYFKRKKNVFNATKVLRLPLKKICTLSYSHALTLTHARTHASSLQFVQLWSSQLLGCVDLCFSGHLGEK